VHLLHCTGLQCKETILLHKLATKHLETMAKTQEILIKIFTLLSETLKYRALSKLGYRFAISAVQFL
jgi:hypothetical protein